MYEPAVCGLIKSEMCFKDALPTHLFFSSSLCVDLQTKNKKQKLLKKKKKREQMYNFALMSKQNKGTGRLYQKKNNVLYMGSIRILSMYELENHGLRREW